MERVGKTVVDTNAVAFGDNSFDYIRLISALMIVVGHASTHLDIQLPFVGSFILNFWRGLPCLFVISGYLISASFDRSESNRDYLKKRGLRLYPGLWAQLLVSFLCIMIVGVVFFHQRYGVGNIVKWLIAQSTFFQFYTPNAMKIYGVGNPNGALWTISLELQMYILIMLLLPLLKKNNIRGHVTVLGLLIAINVVFSIARGFMPVGIYKAINVTFIPYAYYFFFGIMAYVHKDRIIPIMSKYFWGGVLAYVAWRILNSNNIFPYGHYTDFVSGLFLCICTLGGAYHFGKHRIKHDYSYSIYLYHMLVVNVFVMFGLKRNPLYLVLVVIVTLGLAILSTIYVEEPFTKKKRIG